MSCDSAPFMRTVRCRTVAKALSIGCDIPKMRPVLAAGKIEERQQRIAILRAGDRPPSRLSAHMSGEDRRRGFGGRAVLGQPDTAQIADGGDFGSNRLRAACRERSKTLVLPTPLVARFEGNASSRAFQKPRRAGADPRMSRARSTDPRLQIDKQFLPALAPSFPACPFCQPQKLLPAHPGVAPIRTDVRSACGSMRASRSTPSAPT